MFVKWFGKHIRKLEELSVEKEISIFDLKNILLENKTSYMTLEEIVYNISKNYFMQIDSNIKHNYFCEKCFEKNITLLNIDDFKFIQGNFESSFSLKNGEILIETQTPQYIENLEKTLEGILHRKNSCKKILSIFYYTEFIHCVKNIIMNGETLQVSSLQLENILLNDIELKEYENLLKDFNKCKSFLSIEKEVKCEFCGTLQKISIDNKEIPEAIKEYILC